MYFLFEEGKHLCIPLFYVFRLIVFCEVFFLLQNNINVTISKLNDNKNDKKINKIKP